MGPKLPLGLITCLRLAGCWPSSAFSSKRNEAVLSWDVFLPGLWMCGLLAVWSRKCSQESPCSPEIQTLTSSTISPSAWVRTACWAASACSLTKGFNKSWWEKRVWEETLVYAELFLRAWFLSVFYEGGLGACEYSWHRVMVHEWKESDPHCSPLSNADPVFGLLNVLQDCISSVW